MTSFKGRRAVFHCLNLHSGVRHGQHRSDVSVMDYRKSVKSVSKVWATSYYGWIPKCKGNISLSNLEGELLYIFVKCLTLFFWRVVLSFESGLLWCIIFVHPKGSHRWTVWYCGSIVQMNKWMCVGHP